MVYVDFVKGNLCISLDRNNTYYSRVYFVLRSLLSVRSSNYNTNQWLIGYDDFLTFKQKLDSLGLVENRTMSPAAHKYLMDLAAQEAANQQIKEGFFNKDVEKLLEGKLKTQPYSDQLTGISYLVNNWRAGLFDSMGIGKSAMALSTIVALEGQVKKTLIICPKSVMLGFAREVEKHTFLKCLSLPSGKKEALKFLKDNKDSDWDILLVHPENLIKNVKKGSLDKEPYGDITYALKDMTFDMVIVDEWHQYKNIEAKRTRCVLSLLSDLRTHENQLSRVVLLTGTPISESPVNGYVTLKVLGCDFLPHITRFEKYFTVTKKMTINRKGKKGKTTFNKIVGYKNLVELKRRIERISIRRTKDDLEGFPDKIFTIRDVELTGKQKDLYNTACGEIVSSLDNSALVNLNEFFAGSGKSVRLRQLMNHPAFLGETCKSAKYEELDLICEELFADPEQKLIIWTEFRKAVDLIYDRWNDKYGVIKIYGGVDINAELAHKFEHSSDYKIAAAIPAKGGTGVDFLARARTAVYLDRPYSLILYNQSIDRIHRRVAQSVNMTDLDRIKSQPATIMFLDVVNSIDVLIKEKLQQKQDIAEAVTTSDSKLIEMGKMDLLKYLR